MAGRVKTQVGLRCTECRKAKRAKRNYVTRKPPRADYKLEIKKHCPVCKKHTTHTEDKKLK